MKFEALRAWAKTLKGDVVALWIAARDSRTPWCVKVVAAATAAYALSPIDLIPDFIPVIGYLDDLIVVPLGVLLCVKMMPPGLMSEFRTKAEEIEVRPTSKLAAALIVLLWMVCAGWLVVVWWPGTIWQKLAS